MTFREAESYEGPYYIITSLGCQLRASVHSVITTCWKWDTVYNIRSDNFEKINLLLKKTYENDERWTIRTSKSLNEHKINTHATYIIIFVLYVYEKGDIRVCLSLFMCKFMYRISSNFPSRSNVFVCVCLCVCLFVFVYGKRKIKTKTQWKRFSKMDHVLFLFYFCKCVYFLFRFILFYG